MALRFLILQKFKILNFLLNKYSCNFARCVYNDFGLAKTDQKFSISNEEACAWTSAIRSNSCERDRD